jgi:hypothetical protein
MKRSLGHSKLAFAFLVLGVGACSGENGESLDEVSQEVLASCSSTVTPWVGNSSLNVMNGGLVSYQGQIYSANQDVWWAEARCSPNASPQCSYQSYLLRTDCSGGGTGGASSGGTGGTTGGTGGATGGAGGTTGGTSSGGTGGATGGTGGSTGTAPCPSGSTITAVTTSAGYANYGNVFGSSYYQANVPSTANPKKIQIKVTKAGAAVSGCEVGWATAARNGWVFPDSKTTNASGLVSAYWTAGDLASQVATASINLSGGGTSQASITGSALPGPQTRGDSIHLSAYPGGTYTEYKVNVTPQVAPPTTYFATQGWQGAYGGIQFTSATQTKVIFSVWDVDASRKAEFKSTGACNEIVGFGGEGTGTSCRLSLPPSKYGAVAGLPNDYMLKVGDTYQTHLVITFPTDCGGTCADYTFYFTDVTRGIGPISLGTQRYKQKANNTSNYSFVEDWSSSAGDTCISAGARAARFHDMQAKINGSWRAVTSGTFDGVYRPDNTEVCSNYYGGVVSTGNFLLSSGGSQLVSRPLLGGTMSLP